MAEERAADEVYVLMVEVGRKAGDGLPKDCDGAALLCYAAGRTEKQAVDETVAVLREAEMAPLTVDCHGSVSERAAAGQAMSDEDRALAERALAENAVVVAQIVPFHDEEQPPLGHADGDEESDGGEGAR